MSLSVSEYNSEFIKNNYRFSSENSRKTKNISESIMVPKKEYQYEGVSFSDLNLKLDDLDKSKGFQAVALSLEANPIEIKELFSRIADGKYKRFMESNVDGVVFGKNFETMSISGGFYEDLSGLSSPDASLELTEGKFEKLIYVDTYNNLFNALASETENDALFTEHAEILSVFGNELHQAFVLEQGTVSEDKTEVYKYMKTAYEDVKKYIDDGGELSFLSGNKKEIFNMALDLMIKNLEAEVSKSTKVDTGFARVFFHAMA